MLINVIEQDIKNGIRHNCYRCPVAKAITRTIDAFVGQVMAGHILIFINGKWFHTPPNVAKFINDFDSRLPIRPFSFELKVENESEN